MKQISSKQLFQRQTTLSEVGEKGQQKLQQAKVTVVGCGGLGCVAAVYLAGSGVGHIHLIDFDVVDVSNLHRQVFYKTDDIKKPKSEVLADYIKAISPLVKVTFSTKAISKNNVFSCIDTADIVLDCTDNLPIKYLLNDACILKDKTLVYGSLYKFDGYVASFNYLDDKEQRTANLRDAFPKIPTDKIPNCSELGTLNTIVGIIGLLQANEVLKLILKIGSPLTNQLLIYNSLENSQFIMKLKAKITKEKIARIFEKESYEIAICNVDESLEITQENFQKLLHDTSSKLKVISVIENTEIEYPFENVEKIPLSTFQNWLNNQQIIDGDYVVICQRGVMSMTAVKMLKEKFPSAKVKSLQAGIIAF